jgi:hypothetical protein
MSAFKFNKSVKSWDQIQEEKAFQKSATYTLDTAIVEYSKGMKVTKFLNNVSTRRCSAVVVELNQKPSKNF